MQATNDDARFREAVQRLRQGDFSRLEPLFQPGEDGRVPIVAWHEAGRFEDEPAALAEALTCACFLGRVDVAAYLLDHGVTPDSGAGTGLDALHWAANRGQVEVVRLLLARHAPLDTRSMHGGTPLDTALWSAQHEPRPGQEAIVELLLEAGARPGTQEWPTRSPALDAILRRHGSA